MQAVFAPVAGAQSGRRLYRNPLVPKSLSAGALPLDIAKSLYDNPKQIVQNYESLGTVIQLVSFELVGARAYLRSRYRDRSPSALHAAGNERQI